MEIKIWKLLTLKTSVCLYTFVARAAHAHQLVSVIQKVTAVRKLASAAGSVGAHTGATVAT